MASQDFDKSSTYDNGIRLAEMRSFDITGNGSSVRHRRTSGVAWNRRGSAATQVTSDDVMSAAKDATEREHQLGLFEAIAMYPKAVGWSVLASTALIMEGYDTQIIYGLFVLPAFVQKYGYVTPDGDYQISAAWQSGIASGSGVAQMAGLLITGILADRYGYRKTIAGGLCLIICFVFIVFFAPSIEVLFVGELLCGFPWGVFQTITTTYAAEVSPIVLRPYLTSYVNLCWVIGQLIGSGVLRALVTRLDQWAYRIPFAMQWIWPLPLLIGIGLAPESPWWLVRKGRLEEAEAAVKRLTKDNPESSYEPAKTVAMIIHTDEFEKSITSGTSYLDCLRGVDLRRTEICCMVYSIQTLCGGGLMGFASYFYEQAGLSTAYSFDMTMAQFGLGFVGVFIAWALMPWCGRRTLYLCGLAGLCALLLVIGFTSIAHQTERTAWAIGSMLLIYTLVYDITIGPVCYSLVSELASSRLRQKTVVLAKMAAIVCSLISNALIPHQLNSTAWDWGGKVGFFWAVPCFLCLVWAYFRLPEPKDRTFAELDVLFERGISARNFSSTVVDLFERDKVAHNDEIDGKDPRTL